MFLTQRKSKYPTDAQLEVWMLTRRQQSGRAIARQKKVSPAFVSQTLKEANHRIKALLENEAKVNKIKLDHLDVALGFARGYSQMLRVKTFLTFSPTNGIQVWYEHKGDCASCELYDECRSALLQEFKERNLKVASPTLAPTDLGEILFDTLEALNDDQK